MPIAPTLIIGLGGTGSKIIEKVADKVRETGGSQSERIAFVAFDTDINELGAIKQKSPHIYPVQTSTRNTVGEYLNINTNARDNWFPVNEMLNRKTLTEGAAQVRAISRLSFETTLKGGHLDPLHRAIEKLFRIDKDQEEQALRVIITSSLAGGTGSGLILPVAMYLASYLRTKYPKAKAITRGFFLQPDVFYSVITATEEQQNLQVNAYATVRELDAFLMKGDNTLPPQYSDLTFEFPIMAADGVEAVNAMPYDFCFLFDSTNSLNGNLESLTTYIDHAATCIYTLSIGPMSKRSNSREDNVLREVIKNDGRNRYAGAGASRLVYPWAHVRDYVALKWADFALSKEWLKFDDHYRDRQEALWRQREQGYAAKDLNRAFEFIQAVDTMAAVKDGFAMAIQRQCLAYDEEGITQIGDNWSAYLTALQLYVRQQSVNSADETHKRNAQTTLAGLSETTDAEDYVAAFKEIERHHARVERNTEETSGILAYSLFRAENKTATTDRHEHQLETYLRDQVTGAFIHPVSARYFLYQTLEAMQAQKQIAVLELEKTKKYFDNFEDSAFDDPKTEDVESAEEFMNRKKTLGERIRSNRPSAELQELRDKFQTYVKRVDTLRNATVWVAILDEGIQYVTGLTQSFEVFFNSLSGNLKRLSTKIEMHRTNYEDLEGSTTRYVLARSESLDALYRTMPYAGGIVSIDSKLAENIYSKVRQYYRLADDKDQGFFQDLYQNTIIGYFADQVMENYSALIKIDIIEALEREYRAQERNFEERNVEHYVTTEIEKAKRLAAPFLEQPLGEERHPINACAYNPLIAGDSNPKREKYINEHLGNYGGAPDDDITPQEILFYNAIYGIRARDLTKYSAEQASSTSRRPAGQYFAAYHQLVSGIRPSVAETKVITPHIDRRWHTIARLPDLDEAYQAVQLKRIHTAFLSGLTSKTIVWENVHDDKRIYRYQPQGQLERDFIVSNGTPCDQFYEVLDSLTIDPVAVAEIQATVDHQVRRHIEEARAVTFSQSLLATSLANGIALPELERVIPAFKGRTATIFDVAAFHSVSVVKDQYSDSALRLMVENFLSHLRTEVERYEETAEVVPVLEAVLRQQFSTFQSNAPFYLKVEGPSFARRIRTIVRPLGDVLDDLHIRDLANEVAAYGDAVMSAE